MNFLLDAVFVLVTDTIVNLLTAFLSIPITLLTDWLAATFIPAM
jgi:hypothetical protein